MFGHQRNARGIATGKGICPLRGPRSTINEPRSTNKHQRPYCFINNSSAFQIEYGKMLLGA